MKYRSQLVLTRIFNAAMLLTFAMEGATLVDAKGQSPTVFDSPLVVVDDDNDDNSSQPSDVDRAEEPSRSVDNDEQPPQPADDDKKSPQPMDQDEEPSQPADDNDGGSAQPTDNNKNNNEKPSQPVDKDKVSDVTDKALSLQNGKETSKIKIWHSMNI